MQGCRAQANTFESIDGPLKKLRKKFPTAGAESMRHHLRQSYGIHASRYTFVFVPQHLFAHCGQRELILQYNRIVDPAGVAARRAGRIRRRVFYAAGVNHIWAFDQHDKWRRFGLRLHLGLEPFTGFLLWLIVWWTNSNPKLVCAQYFRVAREHGGTFYSSPGNAIMVTVIWKVFQC